MLQCIAVCRSVLRIFLLKCEICCWSVLKYDLNFVAEACRMLQSHLKKKTSSKEEQKNTIYMPFTAAAVLAGSSRLSQHCALRSVAVSFGALQSVDKGSLCYSVLQGVAVCCSVLQTQCHKVIQI